MRSFTGVVLTFGAIVVAYSCMQPDRSQPVLSAEQIASQVEHKRRADARLSATAMVMRSIRQGAKDPDSVQWLSAGATTDADIVCVHYSATNSFGGRLQARAVGINAARIDTSAAAWNKHCASANLWDTLAARHAI